MAVVVGDDGTNDVPVVLLLSGESAMVPMPKEMPMMSAEWRWEWLLLPKLVQRSLAIRGRNGDEDDIGKGNGNVFLRVVVDGTGLPTAFLVFALAF